MVDKIGRKDIIDKIVYLIDNLPKEQNFCLALNGTWGSGKSVVIELLKEKLLAYPEYIVVHYDAWKNSFYSDPLIAMLYCILDTLEDSVSEEVSDAVISKRAKQTAGTVATKVGEAVVDAIAEKSKIVGFIKSAIQKVKEVIKTYKSTALTNNPEVEDYKSYASFLNQTIKQLNEITAQTFFENRQTKFVILVDEIDRCLPNVQLIVLERLHHLFDIHNCAVIVALNKDAIHKNFEKNYGENSEDYLRKFFQYSFELPTNAIILLNNQLIDLFYNINDKRKEAIIDKGVNFIINDIIKVATDIILSKSKKIDNRDIVKYITDSKCILEDIIDYHPALLWFALRIRLYQMFNDSLYKRIVDEKNLNSIFILELESFLGVENNQTSFNDWHFSYNGHFVDVRYNYYVNGSHNDLLFLFNICRYRNNEPMLKAFVGMVKNNTFENYKNNFMGIVEKIKIILSETEHYGN